MRVAASLPAGLLALVILALPGCSGQEGDGESSPADSQAPRSAVWARVNGEPVTEYQVRRALVRMQGRQKALHATPAERRRALESVVRVRAMARRAEKELSNPARRRIRADVAAYRDRLLTRKYLADREDDTAVSEKELRRFYRTHPERFGAETYTRYRMLVPGEGFTEEERGTLLQALAEARSVSDWEGWAATRREEGLPIRVQSGWRGDRTWAKPLARTLDGLSAGETSKVVSVEGRPHLVRVVREETSEPRPYGAVRKQVRRAVRARALRTKVNRGAEAALEAARVSYTDKAPADEGGG